MTARIQNFPLGNADSLRVDLADDRKVLIDFAAMRNGDDEDDKRCNLPKELRADLDKAGRDFFDAVCITHTDQDHCKGFGDFFWLEHAAKYQHDDRIKITELWVPAAAILEENLTGDARIVRSEARHRLRDGKGIRVFSLPERLKQWMDEEGIDFESRKHLIVDAGQTVPGYSKDGPERVEFFVHCPFAWRQDESTVVARNEDSIVMHVTLVEGYRESKLFLASDVDHETLSAIVQTSRKHHNEHRLRLDVMKLPHHCSKVSFVGWPIDHPLTERDRPSRLPTRLAVLTHPSRRQRGHPKGRSGGQRTVDSGGQWQTLPLQTTRAVRMAAFGMQCGLVQVSWTP